MKKNKTPPASITFILLVASSLTLLGCQGQSSNDSNSTQPVIAEVDLCPTSINYGSYAAITGTASFSKRGLAVQQSGGQVTRFTLGGLVSAIPIRFAEIRVLNASGAVVQCGRTNSSGLLKALDGASELRIPSTAGNYTVEVLSRTNYDPSPTAPSATGKPAFTVLFSVKEDIYSNAVYRAQSVVAVSGSGSFTANPTASGSESLSAKIEGGAFNIYNDVITSYEYLANSTGIQNISCLNPKMSVYWKAGFNPAQYIYPSMDPGNLDPLSFYIRSDKELYISGGRLGNVSSQDTDHFDDSVIIHELGHHVENVCGAMDSPGGSHSGMTRIDPRLAWSEGWGNFFGAHIIRNNTSAINPSLGASLPNAEWLYYFDSFGYTDGASTSGAEYIRFNLARVGNSNTSETIYGPSGSSTAPFDPVNSAASPGEGHSREVAISRGLFKSTNSCTLPFLNCANQSNFIDLWKAFERTSVGMGNNAYPFRSSIRFLQQFKTVKGSLSAGLLSIFETDEAMQLAGNSNYVTGGYTTWVPYGIKLVKSVTACSLKIQPKSNDADSSYVTDFRSDQRYSNHFYYIDKNVLPGVNTITVTKGYVGGTTNVDIDLLLLSETYRYNEDCTSTSSTSCTKSTSTDVLSSDRTNNVSSHTVSIASVVPTTRTLLNIRAYTPGVINNTTEYTYTLTDQSGGFLCPNNSF